MLSFSRSQRIVLECVPHVQHDYFFLFNQSNHCFLATSLLKVSITWNSVNPEYSSNMIHPMLQTSQGWDQPSSTNKLRIFMVINMKTIANCGHFYNLMLFAQKITLQTEMVVTACCLLFMLNTDVDWKEILRREGQISEIWNAIALNGIRSLRSMVISFQVKVISLRTRNLCNRRSFVQLRCEINLCSWNEKTVKRSDPKATKLDAYRE